MNRRPSAQVYRAAKRNEHGDPVDDDGHVVRTTSHGLLIGEIKNVVLYWLSASGANDRAESSDTLGQVGIPNKAGIKVKFGDRLVIDQVVYQVSSPPRWDYVQNMSGTRPAYHWVNIVARNA